VRSDTKSEPSLHQINSITLSGVSSCICNT
jgi:hypothetical protein